MTNPLRVTVLVGNPKPASRTYAAAVHATGALVEEVRRTLPDIETVTVVAVDLATLGGDLLAETPPAAVRAALDDVTAADVLVVGTPAYKGTYTGLLKVFLDRLPHLALGGVLAVPIIVAASPQHLASVELHLQPLLEELGARVPTGGLAALETELVELENYLEPWVGRVAPVLAEALRTRERLAS